MCLARRANAHIISSFANLFSFFTFFVVVLCLFACFVLLGRGVGGVGGGGGDPLHNARVLTFSCHEDLA